MSMNPPAPAPTKKQAAASTARRLAARYTDVILVLIGVAIGRLLGA